MGHSVCCVVNCKNNGVNSQCKFYTFPTAKYKLFQREKWIAAMKRINPDGSSWSPKPSDLICSAHFIGNKKANEQLSPSYLPTIFPSAYRVRRAMDQTNKINRHSRFMERRNKKLLCLQTTVKEQEVTDKPIDFMNTKDDTMFHDFGIMKSNDLKYADKECQVNIIIDCISLEKTFTCNRYISNSSHNDVEIQTKITEDARVIIVPNNKKFKAKICGMLQKTYVH